MRWERTVPPGLKRSGGRPEPGHRSSSFVRATAYIAEHGDESWELDALEPRVISQLIDAVIQKHVNMKQWKEDHDRQEADRARLIELADEQSGE